MSEEMRMEAYYYSFEPTGVIEIDRILSSVACAGKAYHHTEDWRDKTLAYADWQTGDCPVDWIQGSAAEAAKEYQAVFKLWKDFEGNCRKLEASLESAINSRDLKQHFLELQCAEVKRLRGLCASIERAADSGYSASEIFDENSPLRDEIRQAAALADLL